MVVRKRSFTTVAEAEVACTMLMHKQMWAHLVLLRM